MEFATLEWVDWFNNRRLLELIGYVPPVEYEEAYRLSYGTAAMGLQSTNRVAGEAGVIHGRFTIVDPVSRESPAIAVGRSLSSEDVVRTLDRLRLGGRKPRRITVDNGSEFVSKLFARGAYVHGVDLDFIQPGKPV